MSIDLAAILSGELLPSAIASPAPAEMLVVRIAADGVITLACLMMAAALITFVVRHRRPLPFAWAAVLCAAVTTLGAVSHALDIVAIWQPIPVLQGVERALSAAVLLTIALAVVSQLPKLLLMRSPEELAETRQRLREETALRQFAEEDLRRSLAELNRATQELEQFAHITSHDLQTPLRTISGFSQLLNRRHRDQLHGDAAEFLDFIDQGARQMQLLVKDLQMLSRLARWEPAMIVRRPLADTLTRALKNLRPEIERSGAGIAFSTLPEVEAHHGQLAQLLHQLIGNAIKFRKPGVRPQILIDIERSGDDWLLAVTDNGIGIPAEQLEQVFQIFRRLHGPEAYEGTGIGLAICRRIAAHHGGEITASSDGNGSRFELRLPVAIPDLRRLMPKPAEVLSAAD